MQIFAYRFQGIMLSHINKQRVCFFAALCSLLMLSGCDFLEHEIDTSSGLKASSESSIMSADFQQQNFSKIDYIKQSNIDDLGFAWEYRVDPRRGRVEHGMEATPVVVDGVMYTSGPWGSVFAVNPLTGKEIWRYDPDVDGNWAKRVCCDIVNRGIDVQDGRIYVATLDGFLVALDSKTGKKLWKVDTFINRKAHYTITSAPWLAGNKIVVGNSGSDKGSRGYFSAYDAKTGEFAWRFFVVPAAPEQGYEHPELELAAKTWSPDTDWDSGGGGNPWGHMAYDPELNLLYVGTGNSGPHPQTFRSPGGGDNLYLASILAINPDDGRMVWHYQNTPGEMWDYKSTQHIVLADLDIEGAQRKVLMQANANGFFYVLDRKSGELLSADKYVRVNWASHVDLKTGRPIFTGEADYQNSPKVVLPGTFGGHNWQPMAFSPLTGLVYIPVIDNANLFVIQDSYTYNAGTWNTGVDYFFAPFTKGETLLDTPAEYMKYTEGYEKEDLQEALIAWNPITKREEWRVSTPGFMNGGTLVTESNLVFQGDSSGYFNVYDAETGKRLKSFDVGTGIMAAPMSYSIDGEQYIAVLVGYGGSMGPMYPPGTAPYRHKNKGRIIAFKLGGGKPPLPPETAEEIAVSIPPEMHTTDEQVGRGAVLFNGYCLQCHAGMGDNLSAYPRLDRMTPEIHKLFNSIVLDGIMSPLGMSSFSEYLNAEDVNDIHAYLIEKQKLLREKVDQRSE